MRLASYADDANENAVCLCKVVLKFPALQPSGHTF